MVRGGGHARAHTRTHTQRTHTTQLSSLPGLQVCPLRFIVLGVSVLVALIAVTLCQSDDTAGGERVSNTNKDGASQV